MGLIPNYLEHQYKIRHTNNIDSMKITIVAKSTLAPSYSNVFLQIWNVKTSSWETLVIDDTSASNEKFYLVGRIMSNQQNYYDTEVKDKYFPETYNLNEITIRLYQEVIF